MCQYLTRRYKKTNTQNSNLNDQIIYARKKQFKSGLASLIQNKQQTEYHNDKTKNNT